MKKTLVVLLALVILATAVNAQEVILPPLSSWTYTGPSGSLFDGPSGSKNIRLGLGGRSTLSMQVPTYLDYQGRSVQHYKMTFYHMSWYRYSEGGLAVSRNGILIGGIPFDKYMTKYVVDVQRNGYDPLIIGFQATGRLDEYIYPPITWTPVYNETFVITRDNGGYPVYVSWSPIFWSTLYSRYTGPVIGGGSAGWAPDNTPIISVQNGFNYIVVPYSKKVNWEFSVNPPAPRPPGVNE